MNLTNNESKTKYLVTTRHIVNKEVLKEGPYTFEQVDEFKYLGVNINTKYSMHEEIQLRISNANKAFFSMNEMISFK